MPERGRVQSDGDGRPLMVCEALSKHFSLGGGLFGRLLGGRERQRLRAVDRVSIAIPKGRTFSLVGESGCGKSTIARCIVGLHRPTAGRILFEGRDLSQGRGGTGPDSVRRRIQMIFQDPYSSLNPRWRIGDIIAEPIRAYRLEQGRAAVMGRVGELLAQVGLSAADAAKYPHQLSGGQRQRVSIARALASRPDFLVCDEPTSALDVSVQAQILNLMRDLQEALGLTYLFISHNLAVVYQISDAVGVMYLGRLVETGEATEIFRRPRHPYTRMLIDSVPKLRRQDAARPQLGEIPNPINPPTGCHFHPRCRHASERCRKEEPRLMSTGGVSVACHAVEEGRLSAAEASSSASPAIGKAAALAGGAGRARDARMISQQS